jgi:hypothetical protein
MKRIWTIIGVRDVASSCKWYQSLFGQPERPPAHDHYGNRYSDRNTTKGSVCVARRAGMNDANVAATTTVAALRKSRRSMACLSV